jgi:hypothetical protein
MSSHLLIYAPVPLHQRDGALFVERQAVNGLRLWAQNFDNVTVMMPVTGDPVPPGWVPVKDCADPLQRVVLEPLPMAYRPDRFLRALPTTRKKIRNLIAQADYLCFAIGGLFGDWGAVSAFEAHHVGRSFAVWTDRVESQVTAQTARDGSGRAKLRARLTHRPMAALERAVIRKATLGLFHGRETFDTYAPHCQNPQVVHDIHISPDDHISSHDLKVKVTQAADGPIRIFYAGRAEPMKGGLDWVAVLAALQARNIPFTATWLGEGADLPAMKDAVQAAGIGDRVAFPGFLDDRAAVLRAYREAQIFLFCHKTPESPRCLIEALASGTVLAGYDGAYVRDLTAQYDSARLVPIGDVSGLSEQVAALAEDRTTLADLTRKAAQDGAPFTDVHVFEHRSALIKQYL